MKVLLIIFAWLIYICVLISFLITYPGETIITMLFVSGFIVFMNRTPSNSASLKQRRQEQTRRRKEYEDFLHEKRVSDASERIYKFSNADSITLSKIEKYEKSFNIELFAKAIQERYAQTKLLIEDSLFIFNDKIRKHHDYKRDVGICVLREYESEIAPFKGELQLYVDKIPCPNELRLVEKFVFPRSMHPRKIQREIDWDMTWKVSPMMNRVTQSIMEGGGFSSMSKGNMLALGIAAINYTIQYRKAVAEKRLEIEKLRSEVNAFCEHSLGAAATLRAAGEQVDMLQQQCIKTTSFMQERIESLRSSLEDNRFNSVESLNRDDLRTVEELYVAGRQLKRLLEVDLESTGSE